MVIDLKIQYFIFFISHFKYSWLKCIISVFSVFEFIMINWFLQK